MRLLQRYLIASSLILLGLLFFVSSCSKQADDATIAVATNFRPALEKLAPAFQAETGYEVEIVSNSTGKLYAQILNGAPFDVFLAADQERPERLDQEKRSVAGSRFTYAIGQLGLWHPEPSINVAKLLVSEETRKVAIANPDLAPYGQAAWEVLEASEIRDIVEPKLVYAENVGQAFAFVQTRNADLGFVARSLVEALPEEKRGTFFLSVDNSHDPIRQDAILLLNGTENEAAKAFIAFLKTDEALAIIERSGYLRP